MTVDAVSNEELVRRLVTEVWDEGRTEELNDLLAPDFVGRGFGPENLDREGYEEFVNEHREIFPDLEFVLVDVISEADRVAVRWTRSGTQQKSVMGVEPTGNRISAHDDVRSTPRLFVPRIQQDVGTLVTHGRRGVCAHISIKSLP